jgi:hypothetical protein
VIGAAPHQRTPERSAQRNGHRARMLSTTAGDLELRIPKLRAGSFFPSLLERRRRVDQALFAVVVEAYLHGVSTRGATPVSSYRRQTRRLVAPRLLWPCAARSRSSSAIQHANDNTQIEFVDRNVRASVGRHAQPGDGEGLGQPLAQAGRRAGVGAVQLPGQRLQLGLGHQQVGMVVGATHPFGDGGGHRVGQPVGDVAELVELAALDDRMVEHVQHGAVERLGAVDHHQDRPSDLQATLPQPHQQVTHTVAFSVAPSARASGILVPSRVMPRGDHAGVLGHADPVDHERHQVQPGQILGEQLRQGACSVRATNRREIADFDVPEVVDSTPVPTGSRPAW